ncbi:MAG: hypothetical protein J0H39_19760 [Alphaproteobacteria bacterium]|jgi:hypothetical protein|uniref:Uncharacterized protein n=1 Tax=Microcystis aeruginosa Ma_OC_H_19870700_S124 TaxID=2486262 RepID=A0A552A850_MICAE|nr:hypothetical protein [Alphaproteobacteria bacterium]TRT81633.1 MAG: hypothetical protein EWV63_21645 [Microcystis aeruginosa Ma_OC_H_19870700_S124]
MIELLMGAFEPQAFLANLIGEATNDVSAKAAFFAVKSVGVALLGMASNSRRPGAAAKRVTSKSQKRKVKSSVKRPPRRR